MKLPREFVTVWCLGDKATGWFKLTYNKKRGFFEPITNEDAIPVIGNVIYWQYESPLTANMA